MTDMRDNTMTADGYTMARLAQFIGCDIGVSSWHRVEQEQIEAFADCTGDRQWIHVDVERATRESPFKSTIAHGYLTLSLVGPAQLTTWIRPAGIATALNYGLDRVRFLAPVPAGTAVRVHVELTEVTPKANGGFLVRCKNTAHSVVEPSQPLMVADSLAMVAA